MVVREEIQSKRAATVGRKLMELPGYLFRVFVTNRSDSSLEIWRDYNLWAASNAASANELAADHFCLRSFFAAESAFLAVLFLLQSPERISTLRLTQRSTLTSSRPPCVSSFFTCGTILGRSGHHLVLHMSKNLGGGYSQRKPRFNKLLH